MENNLSDEAIDLYRFEDYQLALGALFKARKDRDPEFSHRKFAQEAGVKNPGLFVDILNGKRKVSPKVCNAMASIFDLKPNEMEFLSLLIDFGQEKKTEEKEKLYHELANRRSHSKFARLHTGQIRYYDNTGYALILAAVEAFGCRGDWQALGQQLVPPLAAGKVCKFIEELCEWGLIKKTSSGAYQVIEKILEPPSQMSQAVKRLNRDWIEQSMEATFRWPKDERHVSTLLLTVSGAARKKITDKIEKCREEILSILAKDANPDQVMQYTIAYFPRSKRRT